MEQFAKFGCGC